MPAGTQTRVRKMRRSLSSDFDRGSDLRKGYIYYDYSKKKKKEHYDIFLRFHSKYIKTSYHMRICDCNFTRITCAENFTS